MIWILLAIVVGMVTGGGYLVAIVTAHRYNALQGAAVFTSLGAGLIATSVLLAYGITLMSGGTW